MTRALDVLGAHHDRAEQTSLEVVVERIGITDRNVETMFRQGLAEGGDNLRETASRSVIADTAPKSLLNGRT